MASHTATSLPVRAVDRISESARSVYAWHDQELTGWLDPTGRWARTSVLLSKAALFALLGAVVVVSYTQHNPFAFAAPAVITVGLWKGRGRLRWWASAGAAFLIAVGSPQEFATLGLATLAAILLLCLFTPGQYRDLVFGVFLGFLTAAHLGPDLTWRNWAAVLLATGTALAVLWSRCGKHIPMPLGRLTKGNLTAVPPHPLTQVPWLVRLRPKNVHRIPQAPSEITRKKAGGYGERKTALLLLGLTAGKGYRMVHDVDVPGAQNANVDHVVLGRTGMFVLDSKQFGLRNDPGYVCWDATVGEVVHRSNRGARSLTQSLGTIVWGATEVARVTGTPARGVMVVHNARVDRPISLRYPNGATVDVVGSDQLLDRIEGGEATLSASALAHSRWSLRKLRSATTKTAPRVIAPLGVRGRPKPVAWMPLVVEVAAPSSWTTAPTGPAQTVKTRRERPAVQTRPAMDPSPQPDVEPEPQPEVAPLHADVDPAPEVEVSPEQAIVDEIAAIDARTTVTDLVSQRMQDRWDEMRDSEPAAGDEIPADLRDVGPGQRVDVVEFTMDPSGPGLRRTEHVAVSGFCRGADGPYLWVTSPAQWQIRCETGQAVNMGTVLADKVLITTEQP